MAPSKLASRLLLSAAVKGLGFQGSQEGWGWNIQGIATCHARKHLEFTSLFNVEF